MSLLPKTEKSLESNINYFQTRNKDIISTKQYNLLSSLIKELKNTLVSEIKPSLNIPLEFLKNNVATKANTNEKSTFIKVLKVDKFYSDDISSKEVSNDIKDFNTLEDEETYRRDSLKGMREIIKSVDKLTAIISGNINNINNTSSTSNSIIPSLPSFSLMDIFNKDSFKKIKDKIKELFGIKTKTSDSSKQEVPELKKTKTSDSSKQEVPESKKTKTDVTSKQEVPESKKTKTFETSKQEVPESKKTKTPETSKQEVSDPKKTKTSDSSKQEVPESKKTKTPETSKQEVPE